MAASPAAELLCAFANTVSINEGIEEGVPDVHDTLTDDPDVRNWLQEQGLLPRRAYAAPGDHARAIALRTGLRLAFAQHHDRTEVALPDLDEAARGFPLRVAFDEPLPRLVAAGDGVARALGALLVAVAECRADGSWPRLKLCRSEVCQWAFYDASKNTSRAWCSMEVCGNRQKTRSYRARHRSSQGARR